MGECGLPSQTARPAQKRHTLPSTILSIFYSTEAVTLWEGTAGWRGSPEADSTGAILESGHSTQISFASFLIFCLQVD